MIIPEEGLIVPASVVEDIRALVEYNWAAERADYEREGPEANDIFPALERIRAVVGED